MIPRTNDSNPMPKISEEAAMNVPKISEEAVMNIMKAHFQGSGIRDDGSFSEYTGTPETFLSLARICFNEGCIAGMWHCHQIFTQNKEK